LDKETKTVMQKRDMPMQMMHNAAVKSPVDEGFMILVV
jgi:hypothetical protein